MKNNLLSASVLGFGILVSSLIIANGAFAQTTPDTITYPVTELENCKDKEDCATYCDDPSHIDACVTFAEENNMFPPEQLAEAKQVQAAIAKGVKPPACNGKKECDAYCEDSSHMKECITFGEAAGFLQGKDLEDAKKVLTAIDNGATPPACKGKEACDAYCSDRSHIEACMTFSQAAGLMTPEEAQNSQKMLDAIKKGVMPPDCSGKEACDAYCVEPTHTDECINFSIAAGFMTEKEAEMAKKTGGKGPGGCVGKDACDTFCGNQDNKQTCMDFAKENGFDEGSGEQGGGFKPTTENGGTDTSIRIGNCKNLGECNAYCTSHQTECQSAGVPDTQECVSGMPGYDMEKCQSYCSDHQELCDLARYNTRRGGNSKQENLQSEQGSQQGEQGNQQGKQKNQQGGKGSNGQNGGQNGSSNGGPGGCKGQEECTAYCKDHLQECKEFVPKGGAGVQTGSANQQQQNQQQPQQPNQQQQQNQQQQPNQQQNQQQQQQSGQFAPGTYQDQSQSSGQYGPGTYPNQPPPQDGQQQQPPQEEQFAPGTYPNQPPPPEESSQVPQEAPVEQTAPQSFNFNLNSALSAVITAFQKSKF